MSQQALGEKVGVKRLSIARYESGQRRPSPRVAGRIAAVLDLSTDQMWEMFYRDRGAPKACASEPRGR